ncbi:MAG: Arc family DNA-binding protein [Anaerolineales bacterium]|jgi:predicted transcriptional regulator
MVKDDKILVRIEHELRQRLEQAAQANERTVSSEIRLALRKHLASEGAAVPQPSTQPSENGKEAG